MDRKRSESSWRASGLAAALFAITLNFLQPLAHAALMRDGGPTASSLWMSMCLPSAGQTDPQDPLPVGKLHACCLGLAHATAQVEPPTAFVLVERFAAVVAPPVPVEQPTPVGIRDGPTRPRGPPLLA